MGSSISISSAIECQTARIIFSDGTLNEFGKNVKAEKIIVQNPGHFLCDSDTLFVDRYMVAVDSDEELKMGQLYFLLPLRKLHYVLSVSDMAMMLRRANLAIKSTESQYDQKMQTAPSDEKSNWNEGISRVQCEIALALM